jgi:hypothetical protein
VERGSRGRAGLVLGVLRRGESAVLGWSVESNVPGGSTLFEIGSITKTFTSLLLADGHCGATGTSTPRCARCCPRMYAFPTATAWRSLSSTSRPTGLGCRTRPSRRCGVHRDAAWSRPVRSSPASRISRSAWDGSAPTGPTDSGGTTAAQRRHRRLPFLRQFHPDRQIAVVVLGNTARSADLLALKTLKAIAATSVRFAVRASCGAMTQECCGCAASRQCLAHRARRRQLGASVARFRRRCR